MKKCELCNSIARMFCESDQASLCWSCDAKVHSANFLVAKHSRTLLCQSCQSLTPWTGSGPKLGHTLSVCESCCIHVKDLCLAVHRVAGNQDSPYHGEEIIDLDTKKVRQGKRPLKTLGWAKSRGDTIGR
ncbi:B-box domain protein 30 [Heracleum sosnowskyi]|uniref:B-box domain protein 30 n=1 Tax=Heracleum sosnowskyi TaxID=360622 RepID=A0AAD8HZF5_9APIA|nr:B-box domain protein 30 [Heracleum sosnowskyi]